MLDLEEKIRRRELQLTHAELVQSERSLAVALGQEKCGRQLLVSSVQNADLDGRIAAAEEIRAGRLRGTFLQKRIEQLALLVDERQRAFREKQVERKQSEALVTAADASQALEENRKGQQSLDNWFLTRLLRDRADRERQEPKDTSVKR